MGEEERRASTPGAWPAVDPTDVAPDRTDAVRLLMAATDALCAVGSATADARPEGREAMATAQVLASVISRLTAATVALLPVVEADGLWAVDGGKSFAGWLAHRHQLGLQTARVQVRTGRTLRDHLPVTRAAALAGAITVEHAQVLAQLAPTTAQRREVLSDPDSEVNEEFVVRQAGLMGVDDLRKVTRQWAAHTDPDADDRGYVEACEREHLEMSRLYDMYDIRGQVTVEHGQALKAALRAVTPVPAAGDDRSAAQRRAPGPAGPRLRLTHRAHRLRADVAGAGRGAGRTHLHRRKAAALVARDKHCRFPGCTAPPILCDGHHIDRWGRDHGATAMHRGVLLCAFHHGHVHRRGMEIEPRRTGFRFRDRKGREIASDGDRPLHVLE